MDLLWLHLAHNFCLFVYFFFFYFAFVLFMRSIFAFIRDRFPNQCVNNNYIWAHSHRLISPATSIFFLAFGFFFVRLSDEILFPWNIGSRRMAKIEQKELFNCFNLVPLSHMATMPFISFCRYCHLSFSSFYVVVVLCECVCANTSKQSNRHFQLLNQFKS